MKEPKVTVSKGSNGLIVLADIGVGGAKRNCLFHTRNLPLPISNTVQRCNKGFGIWKEKTRP